MPLIREDRDRFERLIAVTAEGLGLAPSLVEKDYWAVEALRAVHAGFDVAIDGEEVHVSPVFKGGTSLSKAFGLIQRFSEDIDLLVPVPIDDPRAYSQSQRADVLRAATGAVSAALGIEGSRRGGRRGIDRHWRYPYEPCSSPRELLGVEPSIRVEVTVMGGPHPRSTRAVSAMVTEHAAALEGLPDHEDLTPVTIATLAPARTLVEKLAMLHDAASQALNGDTSRLRGAGRHYYDVAMLLRSDLVASQLSTEWVAQIATDADRWSGLGNFPFTARPDGGFAASPAFTDPSLQNIVDPSFQMALDWVWGDRPSLEDCVAIVRASSAVL